MAWRNALMMPRPTVRTDLEEATTTRTHCRPQKFLHFMSLRTGTALILLTHLINKVTAVYGILAIFTSFPASGLQLSMYIYSLPILLATIYLASPVRSQSPWHCLAFAYLYTIDSIVNAVYTAFFGVTWFLVLASDGNSSSKAPGGKMMEDLSGFTSPEHNVTQVEVVVNPKPGMSASQDAIAIASGTGAASSAGFSGAVLNASSMMSIFIVCGMWLLRFYAVFVVLAYARLVIRYHIQTSSLTNLNGWSNSKSDDLADDPFAASKPQGQGLKGRIGRIMVSIGRGYWLGRDEEGEILMQDFSAKFRKSDDAPGVKERERRRRSGTGPPAPPPGLVPS
jgi:hypothetical protein